MTIKKIHLFLIISLFLGFACTVQKRHYSKGYQITFKSVKKNNDPKDIIAYSKTLQTKSLTDELIETKLQNDYSIKLDSKKTAINLLAKSTKKQSLENDSCDVMYLRNGEIIKVKVIEINEKEIRYKRFDNLQGPINIIEKNLVKKIIYQNGTEELFKSEKGSLDLSKNKKSNSAKYDPFSIVSLICGALPVFGFLSIVAAIVFGVIALKRIKNSDIAIMGRGFALTGIILGLSFLLLSIIFILVLLGLLL